MNIGIVGISHTYESIVKALEQLGFNIIVCDIDENKLKNIIYPSYNDYHLLSQYVEYIYIATPPDTHYEIAKYFLSRGKKVICEKPLVNKRSDLDDLYKLVDNNFYNVLHFAYGEELDYFIRNFDTSIKPKKIIAQINDPYIVDKHIKKEKLSLGGAYLDETINPLSAIKRIYSYEVKFVNVSKKYYPDDNLDHASRAKFLVGDIDVEINVWWNNQENREKYIDLYFEDRVIRLDSFNVKVIDLTNDTILFSSNKHRMDYHYLNGLRDMNLAYIAFAKNLNEEILSGEKICAK